MSINQKKKLTEIRKKMFKTQSKVTWAGSDKDAEKAFKELLALRDAYRKNGGHFKK